MLEKQVEQYLVKQVKSIDGISLKLNSLIGIPDRLILLPSGRCMFVELKRPGEEPRKVQVLRMKQLTKLGFRTYVADSYESVDKLLSEVVASGV